MYNRLVITGNLTRDPELRTINTSAGEISVCNFTVATNDWRQPHKNGEVVPQYFRITVWRELAERCKQYLAKGRAVMCEGSVSLRRQEVDGVVYADLEMQNANVTFLPDGSRNSANNSAAAQTHATIQNAAVPAQSASAVPNYDAPATNAGTTAIDDDDDDLPF